MKSNKIEVLFAKAVYRRPWIEQAITDYKDICTIELYEDERYFTCDISKSIAALPLTAREFSNYIIELANSRSSAPC